jgi:hypothetical protein
MGVLWCVQKNSPKVPVYIIGIFESEPTPSRWAVAAAGEWPASGM